MLGFWRYVASGLLLGILLATAGCGDATAFAEARSAERKLLMANPTSTYADAGYLRVAELLEDVPRSSTDYDKAQALLANIQDARRLQVGEAYRLDYKSARLAALDDADIKPVTEGVAPTQPKVVVLKKTISDEPQKLASTSVDGGESVILYSTSWCGYCRKARSYFDRNDIDYIEKDIEKDRAAAKELRAKVKGYSGVPVIDIDGTVIRGYDLAKIKRTLAQRDG